MLRADVQLQNFNTLRLASTAQYFASPSQLNEARDIVAEAAARNLPITVLGGGSNVVLRRRIPGCVIKPAFRGIDVRRDGDGFIVTAGAGVSWHHLVRFCLGQGIPGLENLALIPGSVGAAPIQNIGAYGLELRERFHCLTMLSWRDGAVVTMDANACGFGYRDSVFKRMPGPAGLITTVSLRLPSVFDPRIYYADVRRELTTLGVRPSAVAVAEAVTRVRRRKLPDVRSVPNAGSFFKNPVLTVSQVDRLRSQLDNLPTYDDAGGVKVAAARLIDAAGWKGKRLGRASVWSRQPLVLVNCGEAEGADILRLAQAIRSDIAERFGVELEIEPAVVGVDE